MNGLEVHSFCDQERVREAEGDQIVITVPWRALCLITFRYLDCYRMQTVFMCFTSLHATISGDDPLFSSYVNEQRELTE